MPNLTTYGKDPYPTGPEAAWVPGDLMAYAESIDRKLIHAVASQAARDANFAGLPAGGLVTCAAAKTVWLSLGETNPGVTGWTTIYADTGWTSAGFSYGPGMTNRDGGTRARKVGNFVEVDVLLDYSGLNVTASATGSISDLLLVTVPAAYRSSTYVVTLARTSMSSGAAELKPTGELFLQDLHPTSTLAGGQTVRANLFYLVG